jgi:thiol-disulfide isomerase/thioredoxin
MASVQHVGRPASQGSTPPPEGAPPVEGGRPSRTAAWLGMGAVAVALGLLWMMPGTNEPPPDGVGQGGSGAETLGEDDVSAVGMPARLNFTMTDMNGVDVKLASFKGKVILLNFWATWCGPCKVEIPDLVHLQTEYSEDLVVLGVLVQDEIDKVPPFAAEYKINYPLLDGNNREDVEGAFGPFWGIPSSVIIGRDGRIVVKHSGIRSLEQLDREIKPLL